MKEDRWKNFIIALLIIIIIVLVTLIILVRTGIISHDENNVDELSNQNDSYYENDTTSLVQKRNSNWMDYLLSANILEVKLSRMRSVELGDEEEIDKTITLSLDDLKIIFSKLEDNNLVKTYSLGRGGPQADSLTIAYEYQEKRYELSFINGDIYVDFADDNLVSLFDENNYEIKNIEFEDEEGSFYYFEIENYSSSIYDEFFA